MSHLIKFLPKTADLLVMLKNHWLITYLVTWTLMVSNLALAASGAGLTYHGRLVGPDGTPITSTNVQFRLQVRTPGSENCLLFEEIQAKDLTNSNGVFAITINDGSGARQDSNTYSLDQIFANRGNLSFPAGYCTSGSTYSPNPSDGRMLQVYFNDGSFSGWEPVPSQAINFVPMAIEAMQVGGYKKENLVKVAAGVDTTGSDLSAANFTELMALLTGTSTQFIKPNSATFTAAPQWSGTPTAGSDLANKSYVDSQVAAGLPNIGTAGTYTKVTTDSKGRVSSGTTLAATDIPALDASKITTGVLPIANGGTNSSAALNNGRLMISSGGAITEASAMTDGQIIVGKTGSAPQQVAMSGDASVSNTGVVTVAKLQNRTVAATAPALGSFLKWNNTLTQWEPTTFSSCTAANQVMHYNLATDAWSCDVMSADSVLPAQTGNTGKVLSTNGSTASWTAAPSGLPAAAGTAAAPGYAFSGNTNTGFFGAATNQIGISTNGTERLRVDASGNVGIGTTTPFAKLEVAGQIATTGAGGLLVDTPAGTSQNIQFRDRGNGWNAAMITASKMAGGNDNGTLLLKTTGHGVNQLFLDAIGNVGIGTTAPGSSLDVKGTLRLSGSTSGYVGFAPAAAAGSTTYTLPAADGTTGQFLSTNGSGVLSWGSAGAGTVTNVSSANSDISVATGNSTPVLTLNSGTGADQIVKLTAASKLPAVDGSLLTGITTSQLSGVLPIANGGTNSSAALTGSKVMVSSASAIVEGMASNTAKSNNTFVMRDGSGNIAGAFGTFDGLSVLLGGSVALNGATAGSVSLAAPTSVTSYTMTLPSTAGSTGQVLTTDGTGLLSWTAPSPGLPAAAGTAAAPGYAFVGNTNTGLFSPATNMVAVSTNGAERVRIDSAGNVGIGTTAPTDFLSITGNSEAGTSHGMTLKTASSTPVWYGPRILGQSSRGTIAAPTTTGNTDVLIGLIGQSYASGSYSDAGNILIQSDGSAGFGSYPGLISFSTTAAGGGSTIERMRIASTGNVGIGTASPTTLLEVNGDVSLTSTGVDNGTRNISISGTTRNHLRLAGTNSTSSSLTLNGGLSAWTGGNFTLVAGNAGNTNTNGGNGTISAGAGGANFAGGALTITGGNGGMNNNIGGNVSIQGGAGGGTAASGNVIIAGTAGKVGIGNSSPNAKLDVSGQIISRPYNNVAATTFDMNNGNAQYTTASCGAMTLNNVVDGGSYTIAVQGATSGTCTFTDTAGSRTFKFSPANGATTASTHTIYSMQVMGSFIYVSWISGF